MSSSSSVIRPEASAQAAVLALVATAVDPEESFFRSVLEAMPVAVYLTEPEGRITFYNDAAAALWGYRPELGTSRWCGSWKLFGPDEMPMPHDACAMALALKERRSVRSAEAIIERPDGSRVPVAAFPTPLFDRSGACVGAVNVLVDIGDRNRADRKSRRIASIVESTDDAIVGSDFRGIITIWNAGAEKMLGYRREEVIGQPVADLIFGERRAEHDEMLAIVRQGGHIDNYQTVRRCKDGTLVPVSISVSPIKNGERTIGVSTIMRDFSEIKRSIEQRDLLLREMSHRVKNAFQVASSVVALSARAAATPRQLAAATQERLAALARAHALTLAGFSDPPTVAERPTTLDALVRAIVSPFVDHEKDRITLSGTVVSISGAAATGLALLLNEFATNAVKYGALSRSEGTINITWSLLNDELNLLWTESGGDAPEEPPSLDFGGFGSYLVRTVSSQLGGNIWREWADGGLVIHLSAAKECLTS